MGCSRPTVAGVSFQYNVMSIDSPEDSRLKREVCTDARGSDTLGVKGPGTARLILYNRTDIKWSKIVGEVMSLSLCVQTATCAEDDMKSSTSNVPHITNIDSFVSAQGRRLPFE